MTFRSCQRRQNNYAADKDMKGDSLNEIIGHCGVVKELVAWQAVARQLRCGGLCQRWSTDVRAENFCKGAGHEVRMRRKRKGARNAGRNVQMSRKKKGARSAGHEVHMRRQSKDVGNRHGTKCGLGQE